MGLRLYWIILYAGLVPLLNYDLYWAIAFIKTLAWYPNGHMPLLIISNKYILHYQDILGYMPLLKYNVISLRYLNYMYLLQIFLPLSFSNGKSP